MGQRQDFAIRTAFSDAARSPISVATQASQRRGRPRRSTDGALSASPAESHRPGARSSPRTHCETIGERMMRAKAYGAQSATTPLAQMVIDRREPGPKDVAIDILYCGVCHSDLHTARGEWGGVKFPSVPGHEIIGRVTAVGAEVTKVRPGQFVGVGCMVDSCRACASCGEGLEQFCEGPHGVCGTYNGWMDGHGATTYGGYSDSITVEEHFVLLIRHDEKDLAGAAPLLCAGITTWS